MTSRVNIDPRRLDKRVRVEVSTITKGASGGMVQPMAAGGGGSSSCSALSLAWLDLLET